MIPLVVAVREVMQAYMPGGFDAIQPLGQYYVEADRLFPILPNAFDPQPDTPAGSWGLAWYLGLDSQGLPKFAVRDDVALNSKIAFHECGHAFEDVLAHARATRFGTTPEIEIGTIRTRYWAFRGFPGTWEGALVLANQQTGTGAAWPYLPGESLAEAFSAAVSGIVQSEWTTTYGHDLALLPGNIYAPIAGGLAARGFFRAFMEELDMPLTDDEINRIADAVAGKVLPDVLNKLQSGFNTTLPTLLDRLAAGDKHVETQPID